MELLETFTEQREEESDSLFKFALWFLSVLGSWHTGPAQINGATYLPTYLTTYLPTYQDFRPSTFWITPFLEVSLASPPRGIRRSSGWTSKATDRTLYGGGTRSANKHGISIGMKSSTVEISKPPF